MTNLNPLELGRLKSLLAGKPLTMGEKIGTLDILRSRFPDLFSGLTEANLKDNNFLIKYLTNPYNRNKIKNALRSEKSLSATQQIELEESLEQKPIATEEAIYQQGQAPDDQETPAGSSGGGGMPGMPSMSAPAIHPIFRTKPPTPAAETPKPDIAIANKSGYVDAAGDPSKLVSARSDGSIIQPTPKNPTIHIADKSGNIVKTYNIKSPGWLKNFSSNAQIFAKRNMGRIGNGLKDMFGNAANLGGRAGLGAINHGGNLLSNLSNSRSRLSGSLGKARSNILSKGSGKKAALIFAGAFFLIFFMGALGGMAGTTPTGEASPIGSADISSCKFTRGQENPKEASFQSNLLLNYVQEASQKSSIPPVVLAAFIRVESPSSSNKSDTEIANYSATCAQSPTGALGIMQIQPPGTTSAKGDPASCDDCIDAGANLVGKTVATMTKDDYCDPRTNIIVGAGWILKKMSKLGYGDGTKWDPAWTNNKTAIEALVNTYYGCFNYGSATDCTGPYNYADDVSTSIQNCQATGSVIGVSGCPAIGTISTPYGFNVPDYPDVGNEGCEGLPRCHNGIDIAAALGSPVKAPISGNITSGYEQNKGNYVKISDPASGLTVTLEHLDTITPTQNAATVKGAIIGTVGKTGEGVTGPVLHYKIEKGDTPLNPLKYLQLSNPDPVLLTKSDNLLDNNYTGIIPTSNNTDNWGKCQ